jgi:hypothetical protein
MPGSFDQDIYDALMAAQQPADPRAKQMQALGMSGVGGIMRRGDVTRPVAEMVNTNTVPQTPETAEIVKAILNRENNLVPYGSR